MNPNAKVSKYLTYKIALGLLCLLVLPGFAQDSRSIEKTPEERLKKVAQMPSGVYEVQTDDEGRIVGFFVVGKSRISTVLGPAKELDQASRKADLDCSAQLVRWLNKAEIRMYQGQEDETIIVIEGEKEEGGNIRKESSKSVEKTTRKVEEVASGIVRGLQTCLSDQNRKTETYTVVKYWNINTSNSLDELANDIKGGRAGKEPDSSSLNPSVESADDYESKTTIAPSASDLFKKKKRK